MGLTFFANRVCEFCGKPIPDQAHSSRKHCEYLKIDGVIKDCKTAKARQNDLAERIYFQSRITEIKNMDKKIEAMIENKGDTITLEDIEAYDIHLDKASELRIEESGEFVCKYYQYSILVNPIKKSFKIFRDDK